MTEHNLPEPDDAPWLNLTQKEYIYFKDLVDEKMNKIILKVLKDIFDNDMKIV
jgi:hypothetical protein